MQHYQANPGQQPLPFPTDTYDPNTFNRNLPHGNDVTPPVQHPPNLDPQTMGQAAGLFRQIAQDRCGRTAIHTFTYNVWSQGYFNNQEYTNFLQRAMDFTEYLLVQQREQPQTAIAKATQKIYFGALALYAGQYPALQSMVTPDVMQAIVHAGQEFESIIRDVQAFQQRGRQPMAQQGGPMPQQQMGYGQPQQQMGYGGQPQQQMGYGGQQATMQFGGQPTGQQLPPTYANQPVQGQRPPNIVNQAPQPIAPPAFNQPAQVSNVQSGGKAGGRYHTTPGELGPVASGRPSPQQWTAGEPLDMPNVKPTQPTTPHYTTAPTQVTPEPEAVFSDVDEIDLSLYVDTNITGPERPYDVLYVPGGIEVRPAHLSGWKRTRSDAKPYAQAFDPRLFILFHVRWPDGVVEEKLVEYASMQSMDYMKHEIDTRMRGEKIKPNGKVVASHQKILDVDSEPKPVEEVRKALDEELMERDALNPVVLDGLFTASTDLENEEEARRQVVGQLGLLDEESDKLPAYEYVSARLHPLVVPEEGKDRLELLATSDSLEALAHGLVEAVNDGVLSRRYYRLLNDRLTDGVNAALHDNLSLEVAMDSFIDDIDELIEHLQDHHGSEFVAVLRGQTPSLLSRLLNFHTEKDEEGEDASESLFLMDETINYQLPWSSEQVASLNLSEEPAVISASTHPTISRVIKQVLTHHTKQGGIKGRRLRLITTDGQYIEVMRGWLIDNTVLLKLI